MKIKELLSETIGPHETQELELMLARKKPAAMVGSKAEIQKFKPYIKDGTFKLAAKDPIGFAGSPLYFITLPGEEWRGPQFIKAIKKQKELRFGSPESKQWHARLGL